MLFEFCKITKVISRIKSDTNSGIISQQKEGFIQFVTKVSYRPGPEIGLIFFALAGDQGSVSFANNDIINGITY